MKLYLIASSLAATFAISMTSKPAAPQDPQQMAEMMKKAEKYTRPGPHHELLKRFLGKWDLEVSMVMGGRKTPPAKGTTEWSWLLDGRCLQSSGTGSMMGMPMEFHYWLGYDNFKQSYVMTMVTNVDTAMNRAEGDATRDGDALILYGTVDEYLTGEHDKMVKYVFRFVSDDEMRLEVHDLPIGETGTQVVDVVYRRAK